MPFPPFVTCRFTVCSLGRSSSRLGPTVPFAPAASIVWQLAQPAVAKTFAPESRYPAGSSLAGDALVPATRGREGERDEDERGQGEATHLRDIEAERPGGEKWVPTGECRASAGCPTQRRLIATR